MNIFTTINPHGNFDAQNEAMSSWSSRFDVYSINSTSEIDKCKLLYPYINFIPTSNTYQYNNKTLVKLDAVLDAIKLIKPNRACIINSDIILDSKIINSSFKDKGGMTIGTRYELDGDKPIYPFTNGFDIFIFNRSVIDLLYNKSFVIGMPWWDFWVPLICIQTGTPLYHIKTKMIYHRTHKTNYDYKIWCEFGEFLYRDTVKMLDATYGETIPYKTNIPYFCNLIKSHIEKRKKNIKIK